MQLSLNRKQNLAKKKVIASLKPLVSEMKKSISPINEEFLKPIGFFYGRYSGINQKEISIEAQLAVAHDLAASLGISIPPENQYFDKAKSGRSGVYRPGWEEFLKRVEKGEVGYLFTDEQSRLFRGEVEVHEFKALVSQHAMTVLARDIDTRVAGWEFMFSIRGAVNALELITTRGRIKRSQAENVKRGYAASGAPYGYKIRAVMSADGTKRDHGVYEIDEACAKVVRRIYADRRRGLTLTVIAESLNKEGVANPGTLRYHKGKRYEWLVSTVVTLISRAIYKGVYQMGMNVSIRPELAIVSPEDWEAVQPTTTRRRHLRGGGKEWCVGLAECVCGTRLSAGGRWHQKSRLRNLYLTCAHCRHRQQLKKTQQRRFQTGEYQLRAAIEMALTYYFTEARLAECRGLLKAKGELSNEEQIAEINKRIQRLSGELERLARSLRKVGDEDMEEIEIEMSAVRDERVQLRLSLSKLEAGGGGVTKAVLEKQLLTKPADVVRRLFSGKMPPYEVRVMLSRILPQIVYEGRVPKWWNKPTMKPGTTRAQRDAGWRQRDVHIFLVTIEFGELFAAYTDTPAVPVGNAQIRVMVERSVGQNVFTAHFMEGPVTNAPAQPFTASADHPPSIARAANSRELQLDVETLRKLHDEESPPPSTHEKVQRHFELGRKISPTEKVMATA